MAKYDSMRKVKRDSQLREYRRLHPDESLKEIGKAFGISRSRVCQLLRKDGAKVETS